MSRVLLLYGSSEGQTQKIMNEISKQLKQIGHQTDLFNLKTKENKSDIANYDGAVIGSSIHIGRYQKYVIKYIKDRVDELNKIPTAFFSVNLTAVDKTPKAMDKTTEFIDSFIDKTGLEPRIAVTFPGALKFSEYGFLKKLLMKSLSKNLIKDMDSSQDIEFTDWMEVSEFVTRYSKFLEKPDISS
ncbi:flavodoxin domain-containing protein [Methanonatronarchaeum sp. AMET-Sl]|uniref:flavodoxin domain-containing protein n=1 Tax=Methanonatronarchaeum sp. AMET-Sl TaxID=3037654 RepID=UPI00244E29CA|nr:flavodoxin domain-containing protein [Methanonatronarchaeum sp. AMET-Sl]WGI17003.1 flavodoxin domain-containing protein [Methanonatronarchaeum sp. AMET-Sl]